MNEKNIYIVRCGEVALKGMNKPYFERVLLERVRGVLTSYENTESKWNDGLMIVKVPVFTVLYAINHPRLQIHKQSSWNIMLIVCLIEKHIFPVASL